MFQLRLFEISPCFKVEHHRSRDSSTNTFLKTRLSCSAVSVDPTEACLEVGVRPNPRAASPGLSKPLCPQEGAACGWVGCSPDNRVTSHPSGAWDADPRPHRLPEGSPVVLEMRPWAGPGGARTPHPPRGQQTGRRSDFPTDGHTSVLSGSRIRLAARFWTSFAL